MQTKTKLISILLLITASGTAFAGATFQQTCSNIQFVYKGNAPAIQAVCLKADGTPNATSLIIPGISNQNGVRCALSNTAGSMVGDAAAVHLAASTPGIAPLCELGEFEVIAGDPFTGLSVEKGAIRVPGGEGLGVSLRGL